MQHEETPLGLLTHGFGGKHCAFDLLITGRTFGAREALTTGPGDARGARC
jgi:hypothetical protein